MNRCPDADLGESQRANETFIPAQRLEQPPESEVVPGKPDGSQNEDDKECTGDNYNSLSLALAHGRG